MKAAEESQTSLISEHHKLNIVTPAYNKNDSPRLLIEQSISKTQGSEEIKMLETINSDYTHLKNMVPITG